VKYHPGFPGRFTGQPDAVDYCRSFFPWYNHEHRHAGIAMLTPADVYFGRAATILAQRQQVLDQAYDARPDRFPRGRPRVPALPEAVYINPPRADPTKGGAHEIRSASVSKSLADSGRLGGAAQVTQGALQSRPPLRTRFR